MKSTVWAKLLSSLFQGFFGSVKMKSVIGFKQVVELLHQHGAPEEVWDWRLIEIDNLLLWTEVSKQVLEIN